MEEGEIREEDDWGGTENQIIVPVQSVQPDTESLLGRIRRRPDFGEAKIKKIYRSNSGKRIVKERDPFFSSLKLKSGETFYFNENDGKKILLNEELEPNRLIRNIISRIPERVVDRLIFLEKFTSEEDDSDDENDEKVKKRYLGNLKDLVYEAYIKEWKLRFLFRRILILWRIYKMNTVYEKEVDPITLMQPEKEIYLYDWDNKKRFIFDAKSLAIHIESKLMYQEFGFPVPMYPRNPKNNVEFSYKQLVSLYYQIKQHGELRWGFTTLREYNFNKNRWHMYHKSALTMNSIKLNISLLDTYEGRELLSDFIFAKMDELNINYTNGIYNVYQKAMILVPSHWYLEKLKSLAISFYEAQHFNQNRTRIINSAFLRIYKKQRQFFEDLKNTN